MQSLIIPIALLLLLALWGVIETGRKFRREFRLRGKTWEDACAAMGKGEGFVVVDTIWGPQRGLGHPVIWWLPATAGSVELGEQVEKHAKLVNCPRKMKRPEALRQRFGADKVLLHSWAVDADLIPVGDKQRVA